VNTFFAQQPVTLSIAMMTSGGVAVADPDSASYRVVDEAGEEIVASTPLTPEAGSTVATIEIDAAANELAEGEVRGFRQVELSFVVDGKTYVTYDDYLLESQDGLAVLINSFQTYPEAMMLMNDLTDLDQFVMADRKSRITALVNAFHNLTTLQFNVGGWNYINIASLSDEDYDALPERFLMRLRLAQLVEANEALNRFSIHRKRQQGLMSETIGESSMMFRPEKILNVPVTRRSLDLLRGYVCWEVGIGRA
jgi:hypothetical protein